MRLIRFPRISRGDYRSVRQPFMNPMRSGQQPVVVSKASDQLQADRQARAATRKRQVNAGQSE
jgi:hypothetical protein